MDDSARQPKPPVQTIALCALLLSLPACSDSYSGIDDGTVALPAPDSSPVIDANSADAISVAVDAGEASPDADDGNALVFDIPSISGPGPQDADPNACGTSGPWLNLQHDLGVTAVGNPGQTCKAWLSEMNIDYLCSRAILRAPDGSESIWGKGDIYERDACAFVQTFASTPVCISGFSEYLSSGASYAQPTCINPAGYVHRLQVKIAE